MRQAHQAPFATDLGQTAQQEPAKSTRLLDLAKDRLDDRLPLRVQRSTRLRPQLRAHPFLGRRGRRGGLRSRGGGGGTGPPAPPRGGRGRTPPPPRPPP